MKRAFSPRSASRRILSVFAGISLLVVAMTAAHAVKLADQPIFSTSDVPGNLALALSVEYPTAISVANLGDYSDAKEYLGYFDPQKCYDYQANATNAALSYFQPSKAATGTNKHSCSGQWSGNFMNWATMQTIDPFRWAMTGGYRSADHVKGVKEDDDLTGMTILEKAYGSRQGDQTNFPLRGTGAGTGHKLDTSLVPISSVTPFNWNAFKMSIWGRGRRMMFTATNSNYSDSQTPRNGTAWTTPTQNDGSQVYNLYVRVRVCDPNLLESNCVQYPDGNYKPEGLMQQYSSKIRYSTFSYLYSSSPTQQGGVMRAPMGFIGPKYPQPLSEVLVDNPKAEWDPQTGKMISNPDTALASGNGVANSGAMNYLNKFGQAAGSYMTYDAVSELYYAVLRNYQNKSNVAEWTSNLTPTTLDGFPAPTSWTDKDPIKYSCQKNFILGIGDNNTHFDVNTGGGTLTSGQRSSVPSAITADKFNQSQTWTAAIERLEGLTSSRGGRWADDGSEYIAGLAYGAHVLDNRDDLPGKQTITTYWMDVMEYQKALDRNPYWLAAKYGGFSVPSNYDIGTTTALTQSWWNTGGEKINMNGTQELRPNNYFLAGDAAQMVKGLTSAFSSIANAIKAFTTSFSLSTAQVSQKGTAAYASQYDSSDWSGIVTARQLSFDKNGNPSAVDVWNSTETLATQLAGEGWNTGRIVVTWNGSKGAPFRTNGTPALSAAQLAALNNTTYLNNNNERQRLLDYLRGDQSNEAAGFRPRKALLGDVVNAKVTPVGPPSMSYSDVSNPGYATFKKKYAARPTMVYVGANDGMLHAFNGALSGTTAGKEAFAYVPNAVFAGPTGQPDVNGLQQLANPNYAHHFYVDATPISFDVDFGYAGGALTTKSDGSGADWRSILIGGLGKGGKTYYAIDVTDPAAITNETIASGKVLWEFTDPAGTMGYSFGPPVVVKTAKYGWVVLLVSGYEDGSASKPGYLYVIDPRDGTLLESVSTVAEAPGLAYASAYVQDFTDFASDSLYVGDLNGKLWRFDLTLPKGSTDYYPAPTQLAALTDKDGNAQAITTPPLIEISPSTRKRFVLVGTGKLLATTDIETAAPQSFYGIQDGTSGLFSPVSTPITRKDMIGLDVTQGVTLSSSVKGWYIDLGVDSNIAWRIASPPVAFNGALAFTSMLTTGDACSPAGQSRVYVINYTTGKTVLTSGAEFQTFGSSITDLRFVSLDGKPLLIAGDNQGEIKKVEADLVNSVLMKQLNWREIPTLE